MIVPSKQALLASLPALALTVLVVISSVLCSSLLVVGCKSDTAGPGPSDTIKGNFRYVFFAANFRQLRAGEWYILWVQNDSGWRKIDWLRANGLGGRDTTAVYRGFDAAFHLNLIQRVAISIEP